MSRIEATLIDHMGSDETVVNAARVSFHKTANLYSEGQNNKLINYLGKHNHISPFGHCFASFHVKAPVFVARQLVKHKFLRWNEVSRRYVDSDPEFYTPGQWRGKPVDKKQGSSGVVELWDTLDKQIKHLYEDQLDVYKTLIQEGVSPEQARMVLPQSMITEWYWSGSLDAFADMCNLRCKPDVQYESRLVAEDIDSFMSALYPVSWAALRK